MDQVDIRSQNYQNKGLWDAQTEPAISVLEENAPTLTVATIVGVTVVVLVAIVAVFLLGVLIDCRQQRILEKKMGEAKRPKNQRRASAHPDGEGADIVSNMEEPEPSLPPAEMLRRIP